MKKLLLAALVMLVSASTAFAQLNGNGYYRVQNKETQRYIAVMDNRGRVDVASTSADLGALRTHKGYENVISDPATVIYFEKVGESYNLKCQGTDAYEIISYYLDLAKASDGSYFAYKQRGGLRMYLWDEEEDVDDGAISTKGEKANKWWIHPLTLDDGSCFGLAPSMESKGAYYQTFYASFPFKFVSANTKAYYISKVAYGMAVIKELTDATIPAATPMIIKSASNQPLDNKLELLTAQTTAPADNQLKGMYFCYAKMLTSTVKSGHFNAQTYNPATMRVLATDADGSLVFKKPGEEYIPANSAYLSVPEGTPDVLRVVTQAEYDAVQKDPIVVKAKSYTVAYGNELPAFEYEVEGSQPRGGLPVLKCQAKVGSAVGTYEITVDASALQNIEVKTVSGKLTITKAPLTVSVGNYKMVQGEALPAFQVAYSGFKLNETESVLTQKPVVTTAATSQSPAGTYDIVVSGGEAVNYTLSYVNGQLTITDPVVIKAKSYTVEYGEELPAFEYEVVGCSPRGGLPVLTCEAKLGSAVGTYAIVVDASALQNTDVQTVGGQLTITKAPLTISVGNYEMEQGGELPVFTAAYKGFKLNDTEEVLTRKPDISTNATSASEPGTYEIVVSGAEAVNYELAYTNGVLTVNPTSGIDAVAARKGVFQVFDLQGRLVRRNATTLQGLKPGVYMAGGRKVVIRH